MSYTVPDRWTCPDPDCNETLHQGYDDPEEWVRRRDAAQRRHGRRHRAKPMLAGGSR